MKIQIHPNKKKREIWDDLNTEYSEQYTIQLHLKTKDKKYKTPDKKLKRVQH